MIAYLKIENKFVVLSISLLLMSLVGYFDYITGEELSFSFFYLIPISFLALYKNIKLFPIIISSVFAAILWFVSEYLTRQYSSLLYPIWNAVVRLVFFLNTGILLYYLREKQKQLNDLNQKLKELNQEKNKFIGIAAHDLRNPIGGVYALAENLHEDFVRLSNKDVIESIGLIKELSNNSLLIISNLLDISKIESGRVDLNLAEYDYISFIKNHIELNQIIANHKNITIKIVCSEDQILLKFDAAHLGEVIDNLLTNSIKYSNPDSMIIVRITRKKDSEILTEVMDNGIGIPREEQEQLFNYFQKTSSKPTAGEVSTGLGLAISKKIILLHNGKIGMKDNDFKGSNFYYTIPFKQE
ncbi:MAG TPA: HAMP domain-containing sensor histidine kinase [Ignavibacteriaceae bacterium]